MCKYCGDIVNKPIRSVNWGESGEINITKTGNLYGKDDKAYIDNCCLVGADIQVATNKDLEKLKKILYIERI